MAYFGYLKCLVGELYGYRANWSLINGCYMPTSNDSAKWIWQRSIEIHLTTLKDTYGIKSVFVRDIMRLLNWIDRIDTTGIHITTLYRQHCYVFKWPIEYRLEQLLGKETRWILAYLINNSFIFYMHSC